MSVFDDLTTDRTLSTRSIDLRPSFKMVVSRAGDVKIQQKITIWKAESLLFPISKESAPEEASIVRYDQIEIGSEVVSSRRELSIGC